MPDPFDPSLTALALATEIPAAGHAPEWIHVLPAGSFTGADGRGPWTVEDPDALIRASVTGDRPIAVDYDHATDLAAKDGRPAPAAGWIVELQSRPDGIWGRVEWTEAGTRAVKSREYRFLSPVFTYKQNGSTVARLIRASLVNNPNLTLTALSHAGGADIGVSEMDPLKAVREALGLPAGTADGKVVETVKALNSGLVEIRKAVGAEDDAGTDALATAVRAAAADSVTLADLRKSAGVPAEADGAAVAMALQAKGGDAGSAGKALARVREALGLGAEADADAMVRAVASRAPADTLTALQAQVTELMRERRRATVDSAIGAGKITPAQREWALAYCAQDPDGFAKFVQAQPAIFDPARGAVVPAGGPHQPGHLTPDQKALCAQLGISEADYAKALSKETA